MSRKFIPDENLKSLPKAYAHEPYPVGKTEEDQQRNADLLGGYDYSKYPEALTGYAGQDLQRVGFVKWAPAIRTRIGKRGNYKAGFAQLPEGKLIIASCRNNNDPDPAKRRFEILVYESSDKGLSWSQINQTPLFGKEPSLAALPDGTLILTAQELKLNGDGLVEEQHPLARSEDGGRTWEVSHFTGIDYPRSLAVDADGSVTIITALRPDLYNNKGNGSPDLLIRRSKDSGRNWDVFEGKVDWNWPGFVEVGAVRLSDGRLLAMLRRQIPGTEGEGFEDSVLTESIDDGKTWSRPWQLTATAQVHAYITELKDGRLLCTYSNYNVPFGVSAMFSADGGKTWDRDNTIRLSTSNGFYVGWAVTLQLEDESMITSYSVTSYPEKESDCVVTCCGVTCEVVRWNLPV